MYPLDKSRVHMCSRFSVKTNLCRRCRWSHPCTQGRPSPWGGGKRRPAADIPWHRSRPSPGGRRGGLGSAASLWPRERPQRRGLKHPLPTRAARTAPESGQKHQHRGLMSLFALSPCSPVTFLFFISFSNFFLGGHRSLRSVTCRGRLTPHTARELSQCLRGVCAVRAVLMSPAQEERRKWEEPKGSGFSLCLTMKHQGTMH